VHTPLTGSTWDRSEESRKDEAWLSQQWRSDEARAIIVRDGALALTADGALDWRPASDWGGVPTQPWVLVGVDEDSVARFATSAIPEGRKTAHFSGFRELAGIIEVGRGSDLTNLAAALSIMNWHATHGFCANCGSASEQTDAGWLRRCPACGSEHYPRVDPAVIMIVTDGQERALLARQTRWPEKWFSTLAGFVEPGESVEAAVHREVGEEVSIGIDSVRYVASQPWPFPSSLMFGFHAITFEESEPTPDGVEIAEARWFSRDEIKAANEDGSVLLPPRLSISRMLIEHWYGEELPVTWPR